MFKAPKQVEQRRVDPAKLLPDPDQIGEKYQTPADFVLRIRCVSCGRHFYAGDYFELDVTGGWIHQYQRGSDRLRSCGIVFDYDTGEATGARD